MSSVNVKLLRKVQAHIVAHPEQVNMGDYWADCGAVGCIALHACRLSSDSTYFRRLPERAEVWLGLNATQSSELFGPVNDGSIYKDPGTPQHAQRVSDHIDKFIAKYAPEAV